jgi:hypothetical protein
MGIRSPPMKPHGGDRVMQGTKGACGHQGSAAVGDAGHTGHARGLDDLRQGHGR